MALEIVDSPMNTGDLPSFFCKRLPEGNDRWVSSVLHHPEMTEVVSYKWTEKDSAVPTKMASN